MREQIHTIPVNEAFLSGDECPFCYLERQAEQSAIKYTIGNAASYMEPDVRAETDKHGFCGEHMKKLYDYGNSLGNALILQTYLACLLEEFDKEAASFVMPPKKSLLPRKKPADQEASSFMQWAKKKQGSCFLCNKIEYNMSRYYGTFFALLKEAEFRSRVENCKGFCLRHFIRLLETAEQELPNAQREWFYATVFPLMRENLLRVKGDLDWFVGMFDYRQAGADWKNSRDALSRSMQKLQGLHPADPVFKKEDR